jgi:hypothetical protein
VIAIGLLFAFACETHRVGVDSGEYRYVEDPATPPGGTTDPAPQDLAAFAVAVVTGDECTSYTVEYGACTPNKAGDLICKGDDPTERRCNVGKVLGSYPTDMYRCNDPKSCSSLGAGDTCICIAGSITSSGNVNGYKCDPNTQMCVAL